MLLMVMNHGSSAPSGFRDREVPLMFLQRRDEYFARQGEEALFELSGDWHRPLDQRSHFIQQGVVRDGRAAQLGGLLRDGLSR